MIIVFQNVDLLHPRRTISPKRSSVIQLSGEVKKWLDWECVCCVLCAKLLQSCSTLCSPMDCSPPGSSVHAILQARILEWVSSPSPGDLPNPEIEPVSLGLLCLLHLQAGSLPPGKPRIGRVLRKAPIICLVSRLVGETHLSGWSWFLSSGCSHSSCRKS